jgi:hypothetical protein
MGFLGARIIEQVSQREKRWDILWVLVLINNFAVYLNDSVAQMIYAFDFDLESGNISNQRVLVDFRATGGEPDGMIIEYVSIGLDTAKNLLTNDY